MLLLLLDQDVLAGVAIPANLQAVASKVRVDSHRVKVVIVAKGLKLLRATRIERHLVAWVQSLKPIVISNDRGIVAVVKSIIVVLVASIIDISNIREGGRIHMLTFVTTKTTRGLFLAISTGALFATWLLSGPLFWRLHRFSSSSSFSSAILGKSAL
jgi:hypothetical protein